MISIDASRSKHPTTMDSETMDVIKNYPRPSFETTETDIEKLESDLKPFLKYQNVILVGNGGSRTSAYAFYHGLREFRNDVTFEFLSSAEPELLIRLKKQYSKENTLVLVISKSGTNINNLEPLSAFMDYPVLVITEEKENTLSQIAKRMNWTIIHHPNVGGRFSGMTSCGLVPAYLMGIDIKRLASGARQCYAKYNRECELKDNAALQLAAQLTELEKNGYTEIFSSVYSSSLFAFLPLIIQLIHETYGKNGLGQTIFGDYSPESQHHTNQRFFGGRKNVIGLFMHTKKSNSDILLSFPEKISDVELNGVPLAKLNETSAHSTLQHDMQGVLGHCEEKNIPALVLSVDQVDPESLGEFMVFWHYTATYCALLRNQNPFDQPEVEQSKKISFALRLEK